MVKEDGRMTKWWRLIVRSVGGTWSVMIVSGNFELLIWLGIFTSDATR